MPATARFIPYLSRGFPRISTSFGSSGTSSFNWARYAPAVTMSISHRLWSSKSLGTPETKSTPQPTPNFPEKHQVETTELHVEKHPLDTEEWSRVYRFPYIVAVHRLIRLKLYQTVASVLTVPPIMWAYYTQTITIDQASCMVGITTTAVVFLYIAGHLSERFIGAVYENQGKDKVRLAHLTFFGHRKDIIVDSNDIMDLSDVGEKAENLYIRIYRISQPKDPLILFPHYGGIENHEAFERIFGFKKRTPVFRVTKVTKK